MKQKYRILIVDDDECIATTLKERLELEGYAVNTALNAEDAFLKICNEKYHVVLTEIVLPGKDAIDLLKQIKSYDTMTQVIMMTGCSTMDRILSSLEYGANDYILKPFKSIDEVISIIDCSTMKLERWRESIRQIVQ